MYICIHVYMYICIYLYMCVPAPATPLPPNPRLSWGYVWVCVGMWGYVGVCGGIWGYLGVCGGMWGYVGVCGIYLGRYHIYVCMNAYMRVCMKVGM